MNNNYVKYTKNVNITKNKNVKKSTLFKVFTNMDLLTLIFKYIYMSPRHIYITNYFDFIRKIYIYQDRIYPFLLYIGVHMYNEVFINGTINGEPIIFMYINQNTMFRFYYDEVELNYFFNNPHFNYNISNSSNTNLIAYIMHKSKREVFKWWFKHILRYHIYKCNLNNINKFGYTAISYFVSYCTEKMFKRIIKKNNMINYGIVTLFDETLLIIAAKHSNRNIIHLLLRNKVNPHYIDNNNKTYMYYFARNEQIEYDNYKYCLDYYD